MPVRSALRFLFPPPFLPVDGAAGTGWSSDETTGTPVGLNQIVDQSGHIVEAHPSPLSTGGQSEPAGHMTFSQARITDQDYWLAAFDVGPSGQLQDTRLGNRRNA